MSDLLSHFDTQIQNQEQLLRDREHELEQLRKQRDKLAELTHKRDELHAQLRTIESEISLTERAMSTSLDRFSAHFDTLPGTIPLPLPVVPAVAARVTEPPTDRKPTTLKDEIRKVLRAARAPLTMVEIADRIKAAGYKTSSSNFALIVKKRIGEMADVVHVRGEGYKLKR